MIIGFIVGFLGATVVFPFLLELAVIIGIVYVAYRVLEGPIMFFYYMPMEYVIVYAVLFLTMCVLCSLIDERDQKRKLSKKV